MSSDTQSLVSISVLHSTTIGICRVYYWNDFTKLCALLQIRITPRVHEDVSMRSSALWAAAFTSLRNDLLSQPFQLLSGVDILGNTSSALGNMSKGVAALSMDKKFIRGRSRQVSSCEWKSLFEVNVLIPGWNPCISKVLLNCKVVIALINWVAP